MYIYTCMCVCMCVCASKNRRETIITGSFYTKKNWIEKEGELAWLHPPYGTRDDNAHSVFFIVVCSVMPTPLYLPYLHLLKKKKEKRTSILFSSLSLYGSLIRWTIKRCWWRWRARQRHAKCRLSLSVNRRTCWRVIPFMD